MAEVIGTISAVIALIEASIKIYDSAQRDIKLSETFTVVRRRLPIIIHTLETCIDNLEPRKDSIPEDVCEALEATLYVCRTKARNLEEIFQKTVPGENDTREKRYLKVLRRLGKGNKVEELMLGLAEDVQLLVNHDAVKSASQSQNSELEAIINEMKSVISGPENESSTMNFNSGGGPQTNNVQRGSGNLYAVNGGGTQYNAETQNFDVVHLKHKEDLRFRGPVGIQIGQAPYLAPGLFVGRGSELKQIAELLQPAEGVQKQRRLVLGGKGGIGKTQLAIAHAESRSGSHTSIFWLNAASEAELKESFQSTARLIFDVQDPRFLETKDVIGHVHHWLSDLSNTGWLLIFDNYDDPSLFDINVYFPPASHGSIIVTTRCQDRIGGIVMHIKPLHDIGDGLKILQTRSKRENAQSDLYAKKLAERLAGLPLALATAGTYLQRSHLSFEDYLEEYEKRWNIGPSNLQEYRERTLYTTWDLSYARLKTEDPNAAKLLKLLAYFDNQNLWYGLFHDGLTEASPKRLTKLISCFGKQKPWYRRFHKGITEGSLKWLYQLLANDLSFQGAMNTLTDYYFLEVNPESKSWSMHNCVHDWTLAALNGAVDVRYYWYAFNCVDASISGFDMESLGRITFSRLAGHAARLVQQRFVETNMISYATSDQLDKISRVSGLLAAQIKLDAAEELSTRGLARYEKALGQDHTLTLSTSGNLGNLYSSQGKLDQAEQMYTRALAGYEKALGPDHTSTLQTFNNLGKLYSSQGKLDQAEQMYTRALAGYKKALGQDHTSTLDAVHCFGNLYSSQGKLDQAEQMYTRALAGYEKALGPDHTSTLQTINNLGNLYSSQGKLDQAEQMYTRALAGYEKALGPDHTSTLQTINNLGNLYSSQGKLDQAEQMYTRALAGYEKALGQDHTSTLDAVHCFGLLYSSQGKLDQAEQMYTRALAGYEKALGPDHTSTLQTINNLGILYRSQGKLDQAEQMYTRALAGYEKALGQDHTSTLGIYGNLGNLYSSQGKLDLAEQMYTRALAGYEKALGPDHTSTLQTINNLGILYSSQGKLDQAEQMYTRALAGYEKALGPDHTLTLSTSGNLGNLYSSQGKLDQAEQMYTRALAWYEKALGPGHTLTLGTSSNLGLLYSNQGKLDQAEQMYTRALAGYEKALGQDHTSTLDAVHYFGLLYSSQGKLDQAEQMYTRALAGYEKALGPDHTSTLQTINNLGILYSSQGKLDQAEQMYTRALAWYEKALGPDHTLTLSTSGNLGNLYRSQGKLDQAEQMYTRALAGYKKALGPDHTSTLQTINNLGILYSSQGKLDQAEQMYTRALAGYEKALGPDHTSTLQTINNLGNLYTRGPRKENQQHTSLGIIYTT
ncbi:hypothetical protein N7463_000478 [Penicillium fimorum]|uniref:NACHT-NTPase and P-loop NTPases N-terminal domain-containing protein n=1 Tax=Penicillium fimorum TaxID=1882269 RepID=A0A9W9Y4C9_9EURO|nr:hypothetical protein N7463_000478 [Penicillium fimorum]